TGHWSVGTGPRVVRPVTCAPHGADSGAVRPRPVGSHYAESGPKRGATSLVSPCGSRPMVPPDAGRPGAQTERRGDVPVGVTKQSPRLPPRVEGRAGRRVGRGAGVPQLYRVVQARRREVAPIAAIGNVVDRVGVAAEGEYLPAGVRIPYADDAVAPGRG